MKRTALIVALLSPAAPAAGDPAFSVPIDCTLGETCHIQQYTDLDPGPGATDYTCGPLSYDGHKGTDFALPTLKEMQAGVDVLAAAPGTVTAVRDGMSDVAATPETAATIAGRECGNGVVVSHGDGWETQYCHLKRGSVAVEPGRQVDAKSVLGQVGLSGDTQFPHVHLSVRHEDAVVDPFAPDADATCGTSGRTLWEDPPLYASGGLIDAGFAAGIPDYAQVKAGEAGSDTLSATAPALVVWGYAFGSRTGDEMILRIDGPEGEVIAERVPLDKTQAQLFRAVGRRTPPEGWTPGTYSGEVRLMRDGQEIDRRSVDLTVSAQ
ncbi:M23 family metallopeptidase [Tranquillimonas alkanivorans]|uniref:Peptidase family M23 n=1 Tax=Tranquillimonas alkanivorans TaxID=441119 RepID=A0A1I5ND39_9RHOB|nr:M23 family metallopeptidase [Tranquillimonas alkanivorans]SFP19131.1 Peptidase family M23 [Tranquillimonas alkanivorans]